MSYSFTQPLINQQKYKITLDPFYGSKYNKVRKPKQRIQKILDIHRAPDVETLVRNLKTAESIFENYGLFKANVYAHVLSALDHPQKERLWYLCSVQHGYILGFVSKAVSIQYPRNSIQSNTHIFFGDKPQFKLLTSSVLLALHTELLCYLTIQTEVVNTFTSFQFCADTNIYYLPLIKLRQNDGGEYFYHNYIPANINPLNTTYLTKEKQIVYLTPTEIKMFEEQEGAYKVVNRMKPEYCVYYFNFYNVATSNLVYKMVYRFNDQQLENRKTDTNKRNFYPLIWLPANVFVLGYLQLDTWVISSKLKCKTRDIVASVTTMANYITEIDKKTKYEFIKAVATLHINYVCNFKFLQRLLREKQFYFYNDLPRLVTQLSEQTDGNFISNEKKNSRSDTQIIGNNQIGNEYPMNFILLTGFDVGIITEMKITKLARGVAQDWSYFGYNVSMNKYHRRQIKFGYKKRDENNLKRKMVSGEDPSYPQEQRKFYKIDKFQKEVIIDMKNDMEY